MPDDSPWQFQVQQSFHAREMQVERTLQKTTGLSRSQIRKGLRAFAIQQQQLDAFRRDAKPKQDPVNPAPATPIFAPPVAFQPRPFTLAPDAPTQALQDTSSPLPDPPDTGTWILGSIDGTLTWLPTQDCTDIT